MAHELEMKKDGSASMMYVGETPWHGLGKKVDTAPTAEEAIKLAGLDWEVAVRPQFRLPPSLELEAEMETVDGKYQPTGRMKMPLDQAQLPLEFCEHQTVYRVEDGRVLGEVGPVWQPLQNRKAFEWFNPFLETKQATLETAGSLFDGKRIWVLAKLNLDDSRIVGDDVVRKYVLLSNSHDGKVSVRVGFTPIRCVCWNTLSMATRSNASSLLRIRHGKSMEDTLLKVREIMNLANQTFEATADQYRFLATKPINSADFKKYIELVFKKKEEVPDDVFSDVGDVIGDIDLDADKPSSEDGKKKRIVKEDDARLMINKVLPHFEGGLGADLPGVRGTLWGAYNALTSFFTWSRGRTKDARLDALWYGQSAKQSKDALRAALQMAKAA